ncbi:MAG: alpha/beta hydrolase fold domain-containing protein [Planctomycetota bacterium]
MLAGVLATSAAAQTSAGKYTGLDTVNHAERLERLRLAGDTGLPPLKPLTAKSPLNTIYYADREISPPPGSAASTAGAPTMFNGVIPAGPGGTGTAYAEIFKYQLGTRYDPFGTPHPMVIAYHGYGGSANSVNLLSTIDEECNSRGWVYFSPTGLDDQLFGTPVAQQHVEVAMQWMLDNFNIDPDRLYMVGFSMGGGVTANFAARHRSPDGLMIAAIGVVSGTYDWASTYETAVSQDLIDILEHPLNFGGSPAAQLFRYQQASALHFLMGSYPPLPGTLLDMVSMATNLGSTPSYLVWDSGDIVPDVLTQGPVFSALLAALPADHEAHVVSGTSNPHSWSVLNEGELFDFFDGKVVDRTPTEYAAQLDLGGAVSWSQVDQRQAGAFSYVVGTTDGTAELLLDAVENATEVEVDLTAAGMETSEPVRVTAVSADTFGFVLRLAGFAEPPAYLLDALTGDLILDVGTDPTADALLVEIPDQDSLAADVITDATWNSDVYSVPNPVAIGGSLTLTIDAPTGLPTSWLLVGFDEALATITGGFTIGVQVGGPAFLLPLPLDAGGNLILGVTIPNDLAYQGLQVKLQSIAVDANNAIQSLSNVWSLNIE